MWSVYVICADRQRPWLLQQVEIDTQFLRRLNVLDYSLLLAHQPLHHDERHQGLSFATLIMRTKKSVILSGVLVVHSSSVSKQFTHNDKLYLCDSASHFRNKATQSSFCPPSNTPLPHTPDTSTFSYNLRGI